jgi:hypothetical protein
LGFGAVVAVVAGGAVTDCVPGGAEGALDDELLPHPANASAISAVAAAARLTML